MYNQRRVESLKCAVAAKLRAECVKPTINFKQEASGALANTVAPNCCRDILQAMFDEGLTPEEILNYGV